MDHTFNGRQKTMIETKEHKNITILPANLYDKAEKAGVDLSSYEKSQYLPAVTEVENPMTLQTMFLEGNRHARRKAIAIANKIKIK